MFTLPVVIVGLILTVGFASFFDVGGPPPVLAAVSVVVLIVGVTIWIWSVVLILTKVPRGQLITSCPYAFMKHPLYTSVALLVLPWIGFLLDTSVGALIGVALTSTLER
jgi:protein-S-isoprenylcysteine O-methyltransferase Ste14